MLNILGRLLRDLRIQKGLSARHVADFAEITVQDLADLEWQQCNDIDCAALLKVAHSLGVKLSDLMDTAETRSTFHKTSENI